MRLVNSPLPSSDYSPEPAAEQSVQFFRLRQNFTLPATGFSALHPAALSEQPEDLRYDPKPELERDLRILQETCEQLFD